MQSTPVDKFYITRWQEHLCEKKICLGTKCQSHTHIKIVLDLLWQPAASRKRPLEFPFSPEMTERKRGIITFPIFGPSMDAASQRSHLLIDSPARHCLNFNFHKLPFSAFWAAGALVHFHQSVRSFQAGWDEGKLVWFSEIRSFKKNLWIFSLEGKGIPSSWNILL